MAYRPPDYESQQREANDAARRVEAEMKSQQREAARRVEAEMKLLSAAYRPPKQTKKAARSQQRKANDAARREAKMKDEKEYFERTMLKAEQVSADEKKWNAVAEERIAEAEKRNKALEKLCQDLQGQVNNLKLELSQTATMKTNLEQGWTKLAGEKHSLQGQLQSVQDSLRSTKGELAASRRKVEEQDKALEASSVEGKRLQYEVQTITASRYHFQAVSKTLAEEKKKLEESLSSTKGELAASRRKVKEHDEAKETFQKDLNVLTEAKTRAEKEIEKITHIVKYLKEEAKTKDEDYRELESKYKVLEDGRENAQLTEKLEDAKLKLQKAQSDLENEQINYELEKDTTKHLRTEIAQLNHSLSSQEIKVQALMDKGSHRREVMQQVVKLLQAQVAAVRSDLDQERSRQSELKDSVEQLLTRSFIVRFLKTELVSRAAELQKCRDELQKCRDEHQKCRDELRTTTAERDRLRHTIAMKQYMDQHFHKLQEQMRRNLVQIVTKVIAGVREVSASGVSELNKEVQQFQDQTSFTSSAVHQSLTAPAPVSKNLTEDGTRPQEILCMSQPQSGVPNALVKYQPGDAEGASVQCSSPGSARDFWQVSDSHARSTGLPSRAPLLQESVDPSLLQQALTLQKLMPYIPDLADKGSYIAGYLDMQKQWDSLASSHPELGGRLQKLLSTWLEGEDSETPHTWGFFISLVQKKGIDQHQLARKICSNLNTFAPNS